MNEAEKKPTDRELSDTVKPLRPGASLAEQWDTGQRIIQELRNRVRRERMDIVQEYDRLVVETNAAFDRRIDEAVTQLEAERRADLRALADKAAEKLREHELLNQRMG